MKSTATPKESQTMASISKNSNTDQQSIQDVLASDQYKRQLWGWERLVLSLIFLNPMSHIPRQNQKLFVHFQIKSGKGPYPGLRKYRYWGWRRTTGYRNVPQVHASTGTRHATIWRVVGASNSQFSNRLQIVINKCLWLTWRISLQCDAYYSHEIILTFI